MSDFICIGRSIVERDGYKREVTHVYRPEKPYRIRKALTNFYISLKVVNGDQKRSIRILRLLAMSTIPSNRMKIIDVLHKYRKSQITTVLIESNLNISPSLTRRILEDMEKQKMIRVKPVNNSKLNFYEFIEGFYELIINSFVDK